MRKTLFIFLSAFIAHHANSNNKTITIQNETLFDLTYEFKPIHNHYCLEGSIDALGEAQINVPRSTEGTIRVGSNDYSDLRTYAPVFKIVRTIKIVRKNDDAKHIRLIIPGIPNISE